jgi:hypothetical protein
MRPPVDNSCPSLIGWRQLSVNWPNIRREPSEGSAVVYTEDETNVRRGTPVGKSGSGATRSVEVAAELLRFC